MWAVSIFKWIASILALGMILSMSGRLHFMLDNLSSFKPHFAAGFAMCVIAFFLLRQFAWLSCSALGLAVSLVAIVPWFLPTSGRGVQDDGATPFTVLVSNVSPRIKQHRQLENLIKQESPTVFGLVEITPQFLKSLSQATGSYRYSYEAPAEGFWGLALYSKLPLFNARTIQLSATSPPAIAASVEVNGSQIELILLHPYPPMSANLASRRNAQLAALATHVEESNSPTIVLGDLNIALWSPYYRQLIAATGLRNAREGQGVAPSWPSVPFVGVPIDHVLSTGTIMASDFRVLPNIGSDHFPVIADFRLDWTETVQGVINDVQASDTATRVAF